ncbi:cilia- and flagella-associated protein 77 isoform X2 [Lampetra fluviatilis]
MYHLLGHRYQELWLQQMREHEELCRQNRKGRVVKWDSVQETRTSLLRRHSPPLPPQPLWQLSKFTKVLPHLDTFRSPKEREAAFKSLRPAGQLGKLGGPQVA